MADVIQLPYKWKPRDYQMPAWKAWGRGIKRSLLIWNRRAGKDECAMHKACVEMHKRPGNYLHAVPEFSHGRRVIWDAINPATGIRRIDEIFPHDLRASTNSTEMSIKFKNGAMWSVVGTDDYNKLMGSGPLGICFSEFALANPAAWGHIAPILAANSGYADFVSTPRGKNHLWSLYQTVKDDPEWFTQILTVEDTKLLTEAQIEQQRREYRGIYGVDIGDSLIQQEFWCSFEAAVLGSYWGRELIDAEQAGRISSVPYDPAVPCHTAWDLGIGDSTAIWFFQVVGPEIHVIDHYEANSQPLAHYFEVLESKPYEYGEHYLPHDARARELIAGRTRAEEFARWQMPRILPMMKVADRINAARVTLPRCWFDSGKCKDGLEALRQYRSSWNDEKKVFSDAPLHDWSSHSADAFSYLCAAWRGKTGADEPPTPRQIVAEMCKPLTLDQMWQLHIDERYGGDWDETEHGPIELN
jgi:phage terminase large subunit